MVFADDANRPGLCPLSPIFLYEANVRADAQGVDGVVKNAVAVEADFAATGGFNESAILTGDE